MKITHAESWTEDLELTRPYRIAGITHDRVHNLFLQVRSEGNLLGVGCAAPSPRVTGETVAAAAEATQAVVLDLLRGADLRDLRSLLRRLERELPAHPAARAAADMALHDLCARALGLPLVRLLGQVHDSMPTSITLGIRGPEESQEEAREYVERGFRVLKVKIGDQLERDLEVLRRLRRDLGPEVLLRVDANQGYDEQTLAAFMAGSEDLDLELVEQPVPREAESQLQELSPLQRRFLAADESLHGPGDALRLAQAPHLFGIFNIKLMKCGGIAPALEIASTAQRAGVELMWGCNDESAISISAALHAALASPATRYLDLDGSLDLARDPAQGGFHLERGVLQPLPEPGLGIRLAT